VILNLDVVTVTWHWMHVGANHAQPASEGRFEVWVKVFEGQSQQDSNYYTTGRSELVAIIKDFGPQLR
jgi:hypothetical protein